MNQKRNLIYYTTASSPIGALLVAGTKNEIRYVCMGASETALRSSFERRFDNVLFSQTAPELKQWTRKLLDYLSGKASWPTLPYKTESTAFQKKVWDFLRKIPSGKTLPYAEVAKRIGKPRAARAVARACASNPVALVVPCHRIVPKSGGIGGYYWHPKRKKYLINLEDRTC